MRDVTPNLKETVDCPCGCGLHGVQRAKTWVDGTRHVIRCGCKRCVGGRQRAKSRRRENKVANAIGGTREPLSGGLTGIDVRSDAVEIEETANEGLVRGLRRWWESKQIRTKRARLWARSTFSDAEPVFVASWDGKPRLAVMEFDSFARLAERANTEIIGEEGTN